MTGRVRPIWIKVVQRIPDLLAAAIRRRIRCPGAELKPVYVDGKRENG